MTHLTSHMATLFGVAVLVGGCASAPHTPQTASGPAAPPQFDCRQLAAEIASAGEKKRAAREKEANAWKAVIPVAVAARHIGGKREAADADERLAQLQSEAGRKGCVGHGQ